MRIISGTAKGIMLQVPKSEVRPTTDRVREALFSIIGAEIKQADILDLFCGSGALALESLSRGARSAVMVDAAFASCEITRKNMEKAKVKGGRVVNADALAYVSREARNGAKYDFIFADPPYCKSLNDRDFLFELLSGSVGELLKDGGFFIGEAESGYGIAREETPLPEGWMLVTRREYGKNTLLFLQPRSLK